MVAILVFFLVGFVIGLVFSAGMMQWSFRFITCALMWSPIAALIILQYFEAIDPDTISFISLLTPRAIKYPLLGILVGYTLHTLLTVGEARRSGLR